MACRPIPTMTKSHDGGNVSLMIKMGMWCLRISLKHTYWCYHHYDHHHLHSCLHHHHHLGVQWFTTKCPSGRLHNICWATLRFIWKVHLIMTMMTMPMTMVTGKTSRINCHCSWKPWFEHWTWYPSRKPLMIMAIFGYLILDIVFLINSFWFHQLRVSLPFSIDIGQCYAYIFLRLRKKHQCSWIKSV